MSNYPEKTYRECLWDMKAWMNSHLNPDSPKYKFMIFMRGGLESLYLQTQTAAAAATAVTDTSAKIIKAAAARKRGRYIGDGGMEIE